MAATESDKTPSASESRTGGEYFYPDSSRSLEGLRETRLMALLSDMIEAGDRGRAAATLGVSYRTLARAVETGRLTARMTAALEKHLLLGGGSAAAQQRERSKETENRIWALENELRGGIGTLIEEVQALREVQENSMQHVERRLMALESSRNVTLDAQTGETDHGPSGGKFIPRRDFPQLVTSEPEPDEDLVYGKATPVIVQWRMARTEFLKALKTGTTLDRTEVQERMLGLEIALIEEHELTLPPASFPWDEFARRDQLWERNRDLEQVRTERSWALVRQWVRRALTFGLWRN